MTVTQICALQVLFKCYSIYVRYYLPCFWEDCRLRSDSQQWNYYVIFLYIVLFVVSYAHVRTCECAIVFSLTKGFRFEFNGKIWWKLYKFVNKKYWIRIYWFYPAGSPVNCLNFFIRECFWCELLTFMYTSIELIREIYACVHI